MRPSKRILLLGVVWVTLALVGALRPQTVTAVPTSGDTTPSQVVLVELFTSEG